MFYFFKARSLPGNVNNANNSFTNQINYDALVTYTGKSAKYTQYKTNCVNISLVRHLNKIFSKTFFFVSEFPLV